MQYYSVSLALHCQATESASKHKEVLVYIVTATGFDHALEQALKIGARIEKEYQDKAHHCQFVEVEYIRRLGLNLSNCQVASRQEPIESLASSTIVDDNCPEPTLENPSAIVQAYIFSKGVLSEQRTINNQDDMTFYCNMYDDSCKSFCFSEQYQQLMAEEHLQGNQHNYELYASYIKWNEVQEDRRKFTVFLIKQ